MSVHPIDDLFKKRFGNQEEPYPEHIWKKVDEELHGSGRRRRGGAWMMWSALAAFLLISVGTVAYFYGDSENSNETQAIHSIEETTIASEGSEHSNATQEVDASSQQSMEENQGSNEEVVKNYSDINEETENREFSLEQESEIEKKHLANETLPKANATNDLDRKGSTTGEEYATSLEKSFIEQIGGTKDDVEGRKRENLLRGKEAKEIDQKKRNHQSEPNKLLADNLTNVRLNSLNQNWSKTRDISDHLPEDFGYGKNKIRIRWSLAVIYGYDFSERNLSAKGKPGEGLEYYRQNHESISNAFTTGAEVNLHWHNWTLKTGLHYAQVNDRYVYTVDNTEQIVNGQPVVGTATHSIVNRYQSYEIPIWIGYEWDKNKWTYGIEGGINMGIHYQVSGQVFDDRTLSVVDLAENEGYRTNLGVIPSAGLMIGYKMGYNSLIFFRPTYRHYVNSLTRDSYLLDHEQSTISLTAGIRYRL